MKLATEQPLEPGAVRIYNLGTDETIVVDDSIATITAHLGVAPELEYTGGIRGWLGRQPADPPRLRAHSLARLATDAVDSGRDQTDGRLARAEPERARRASSRMSVIFSRAPLRVSLGGGGTDLPSYYRQHGGFLVSGAIDKYVYMLTHTVFQRRYRMKYSQFEEVDDPSEIRHPILRESLLRHWNGDPLEVSVIADVPAGTGLGSSGSFTVCFLKALALARRVAIPPGRLAEDACEIEIDVLGEPTGKQDQYVSAHGGICAYTFNRDGSVDVEPLSLSRARRSTGCATTSCSSTRARLAPRPRSSPTRSLERRAGTRRCSANLDRTKASASTSGRSSSAGTSSSSRELMHEHWENKLRRSPGMATERIDHLYTLARRSGVIGGKVVGAGGGGFLVVYARRPDDTRLAMAAAERAGAPVRLRVPGLLRRRVHVTAPETERPALRVGIVGCGLVGHKRAAALGQDSARRLLRPRRARGWIAGRPVRRVGVSVARRAAGTRARRRDRRGAARPTRRARLRGSRARRRTSSSRSPRASGSPTSAGSRARPRPRVAGSRSASTIAFIRERRGRSPRRGREVRSGPPHARPLRPRGSRRLRAGVARAASGLRGRRVGRPGNAPLRPELFDLRAASAQLRRSCAPSTGRSRSRTMP